MLNDKQFMRTLNDRVKATRDLSGLPLVTPYQDNRQAIEQTQLIKSLVSKAVEEKVKYINLKN